MKYIPHISFDEKDENIIRYELEESINLSSIHHNN